MNYESIVISSGHGKLVRGASGILDEVDEARVVEPRGRQGKQEATAWHRRQGVSRQHEHVCSKRKPLTAS